MAPSTSSRRRAPGSTPRFCSRTRSARSSSTWSAPSCSRPSPRPRLLAARPSASPSRSLSRRPLRCQPSRRTTSGSPRSRTTSRFGRASPRPSRLARRVGQSPRRTARRRSKNKRNSCHQKWCVLTLPGLEAGERNRGGYGSTVERVAGGDLSRRLPTANDQARIWLLAPPLLEVRVGRFRRSRKPCNES